MQMFARYKVIIRNIFNFNIKTPSYRGFKNDMTYDPSKYI